MEINKMNVTKMVHMESVEVAIGSKSEIPAAIVSPVLAALMPSKDALTALYCFS